MSQQQNFVKDAILWNTLYPPPPPVVDAPCASQSKLSNSWLLKPYFSRSHEIRSTTYKERPHCREENTQENSCYKIPSQQETELNKPWVNDYLAREIRRKFYLQNVGGTSKKLEDFELYRRQRDSVKRIHALARDAYFRNNPGEESQWLPQLAMEAAQTQLTCENCDRDFYNEQDLLDHEVKHETCGLDGCTYTSNPKQVEIHILHLHSTGLYIKRKRNEEINDTNSKVMSREEAEKWREERRKKFPSVAKSEQCKRQRKLRYDRKVKFIEDRQRKEIEREAVIRKRREDAIIKRREMRENDKEARNKNQKRASKRKRIDTRQIISKESKLDASLTTVSTNGSNQRSYCSTNEKNVDVDAANKVDASSQKTGATEIDKIDGKGYTQDVQTNSLEKKFWKQSSTSKMVLDHDQPFWFGYIEPFKGTKYDYTEHFKQSDMYQKLNAASSQESESKISDEEENDSCTVPIAEDIFESSLKDQTTGDAFWNTRCLKANQLDPKKDHSCLHSNSNIKEVKTINSLPEKHHKVTSKAFEEIDEAQSSAVEKPEPSDDQPPDEMPVLRKSPLTIGQSEDVSLQNLDKNVITDNSILANQDMGATKSCQNSSKSGEFNIESCPRRRSFKIIRKAPQPPTLLEKLLTKNIEQERDELLQCLRYVVEKKYLLD